MHTPELSLIVATVGRVEPLARLLFSLSRQSSRGFEVVIVDQNDDERLLPLLARYAAQVELTHLRSAVGLSRARNVGLRAARGNIVGFPDDDCWYDADVVARCLAFFAGSTSFAGLTGACRDERGRPSAGRLDEVAGAVERFNVFRRAVSTTLFCRVDVARAVGGFDEGLGLGAGTPWGSGEETDFVLRCLARGHAFYFDPTFVVRHPQVRPPSLRDARRRGRAYGRGFARVLTLHGYSRTFRVGAVLRPGAGAALALARLRPAAAALSFWSAVGRLDELIAP